MRELNIADIFQFAGSHMITFLAPALLVFCALAFADQMAFSLVRIVKYAGKYFRI